MRDVAGLHPTARNDTNLSRDEAGSRLPPGKEACHLMCVAMDEICQPSSRYIPVNSEAARGRGRVSGCWANNSLCTMVGVLGTPMWCRGVRRTRERVQSVRESQGRRARRGAVCTGRTGTVQFVEGRTMEAGVTDGVGVTVVVASLRCAGRQ